MILAAYSEALLATWCAQVPALRRWQPRVTWCYDPRAAGAWAAAGHGDTEHCIVLNLSRLPADPDAIPDGAAYFTLRAVLLHELAHVLAYQRGTPDRAHGKDFLRACQTLATIGSYYRPAPWQRHTGRHQPYALRRWPLIDAHEKKEYREPAPTPVRPAASHPPLRLLPVQGPPALTRRPCALRQALTVASLLPVFAGCCRPVRRRPRRAGTILARRLERQDRRCDAAERDRASLAMQRRELAHGERSLPITIPSRIERITRLLDFAWIGTHRANEAAALLDYPTARIAACEPS